MEPVLYVMAILGCGDGQAACQQVRIEPARYTSAASCQAATADALLRSTDLPYPTVVSECRAAGGKSATIGKGAQVATR